MCTHSHRDNAPLSGCSLRVAICTLSILIPPYSPSRVCIRDTCATDPRPRGRINARVQMWGVHEYVRKKSSNYFAFWTGDDLVILRLWSRLFETCSLLRFFYFDTFIFEISSCQSFNRVVLKFSVYLLSRIWKRLLEEQLVEVKMYFS